MADDQQELIELIEFLTNPRDDVSYIISNSPAFV
jgi:hypothetical protein